MFKNVEDSVSTIEKILKDYNLSTISHTIVSEISGGQKRKLQTSIALLGKAEFILLDEPSSGMDPVSRREMWHIIQKEKADKLIILTTHYMDEAEFLADRVAIMTAGKIECVGTPFFLKNKYGTGYVFKVDKLDASKDLDDLENHLRKHLPDLTFKEQGNEF